MEKKKVYCPKLEKVVEIEISITDELKEEESGHPKCPKYPLWCADCWLA
jgi:hypothetical protein